MRLKLLSCEVLFREMCDALARSPHQIDVEFLPKGLHDLGGAAMNTELQKLVDAADPQKYEAVLMGYALCGNGLAGLKARHIPLVAPRAHDCIALLMGSRQKYQEFFDANPGVYFRSTGWLERGQGLQQLGMKPKTGAGYSMDELVAKYGEENAAFLYEELNRYKSAYQQLTYIKTGLEPDAHFEQQAQAEAVAAKWRFTVVEGNLSLFRRLLNGEWDSDDFVVVEPGHEIVVRWDERVIDTERSHL